MNQSVAVYNIKLRTHLQFCTGLLSCRQLKWRTFVIYSRLVDSCISRGIMTIHDALKQSNAHDNDAQTSETCKFLGNMYVSLQLCHLCCVSFLSAT